MLLLNEACVAVLMPDPDLAGFILSGKIGFGHHTLARQCESVVRATIKVYGKGGNLTPRHAKTP